MKNNLPLKILVISSFLIAWKGFAQSPEDLKNFNKFIDPFRAEMKTYVGEKGNYIIVAQSFVDSGVKIHLDNRFFSGDGREMLQLNETGAETTYKDGKEEFAVTIEDSRYPQRPEIKTKGDGLIVTCGDKALVYRPVSDQNIAKKAVFRSLPEVRKPEY